MRVVTEKEVESLLDGVIQNCAGLSPGVVYSRVHDDHDGSFAGHLEVYMMQTGDMGLSVIAPEDEGLIRFRSHFGGGLSPRVFNALVILAKAIELDNKQDPKRR